MFYDKFAMFQRIQSFYLMIIIALGVLLCFAPVIVLTSPDSEVEHRIYELSADGIEEISPAIMHGILEKPIELQGLWGLLLASALISVCAFIALLLFQNRILQARFNIFLAMLCLGYYGILFMYVWFCVQNFGLNWRITFWTCIPLICFVLVIAATRAILRDEARIRASERLR